MQLEGVSDQSIDDVREPLSARDRLHLTLGSEDVGGCAAVVTDKAFLVFLRLLRCARIQLDRPHDHLELILVEAMRDRCLESALADKAPLAAQVGPHFDDNLRPFGVCCLLDHHSHLTDSA